MEEESKEMKKREEDSREKKTRDKERRKEKEMGEDKRHYKCIFCLQLNFLHKVNSFYIRI